MFTNSMMQAWYAHHEAFGDDQYDQIEDLLIEEMSEFIQAICKRRRRRRCDPSLSDRERGQNDLQITLREVEELADVTIVLEFWKRSKRMGYSFNDIDREDYPQDDQVFRAEITRKCQRLTQRLADQQAEIKSRKLAKAGRKRKK